MLVASCFFSITSQADFSVGGIPLSARTQLPQDALPMLPNNVRKLGNSFPLPLTSLRRVLSVFPIFIKQVSLPCLMDIPTTQPTAPRPRFGFQFVILGVFLALSLIRIYADWLWFDSLGYLSVFKTALFSKILTGAGVAALFFAFFAINLLVVQRQAKLNNPKTYYGIAFALSIVAGFFSSSFWFIVPRFLNTIPFGFVDPLFKKDIAFYVMTLPFYQFFLTLAIIATLAMVVMTFVAYLLSTKAKKAVKQAIEGADTLDAEQSITKLTLSYSPKGKSHLACLFGILLLLISCFFFIKRYSVLFAHRGAVYGAGYTDVHVVMPLYTILAILSIAVAAVSFTYSWHQKGKLLMGSAFALLVIFFGGMLATGLVQMLYVDPNEFNLEQPYLVENIKHTLYAYKLSDVDIMDFPVSYDLDSKDIAENQQMIDNIRLWDWRPLLTTYRQLQLFRTYYDFTDVDIDRYTIDGEMTQLMISPREMDQEQLDSKAKTWVNQKLAYTHGYGVVSSPVHAVSKEGLPDLFVQDIPPKTAFKELEIKEPRIYFGEMTTSYAVVDTKANEFDYPLGNENVFTTYNGTDGVALNGFMRKLVFSISTGSLNLMISSALTPQSKIIVKRNIMERVRTLAPFMEYDDDPYIVISEGKLYWMIDAYTYSNKFPYSEKVGGLNYIRNSVKVVVDAYNGDATFYVIDGSDPLIKNYMAIFPALFKPFSEMPVGLQGHVRYPEDLFSLQNHIYGTYHMKDPQVFYNKEDMWQTPKEIYDRDTVEMEPYYIILTLPGEEKEDFIMITPLIPRGKDNMIAWMSASSNPMNYGRIEVFKFSKQELIYGPMQIEARINQDTDIAQLFTLWGQQGSQVIRGNMIVIPIENSFLYIEPVYLKASASGALPQLKRVVVAYGDQLTMQETLDDALHVLFGGAKPVKKTDKQETTPVSSTLEGKFAQASKLYAEAQSALQQGDFVTYAQKIEEMGGILIS